jgi:hypothetical protein
MKYAFWLLALAPGLFGAAPAAAQPAAEPAPAQVTVHGTLNTLRVRAAGPDVVITLEVQLRDGVQVQVQVPKVPDSKEVGRLLNKGVVAGGVLKAQGKDLILVGKARPYEHDRKGNPPKGGATVEGEAVPGTYDLGKGEKSPLAVRNGAALIVVGGKLAGERKELRGPVHASGSLQVDDRGNVRIVADRLDAVKKQLRAR